MDFWHVFEKPWFQTIGLIVVQYCPQIIKKIDAEEIFISTIFSWRFIIDGFLSRLKSIWVDLSWLWHVFFNLMTTKRFRYKLDKREDPGQRHHRVFYRWFFFEAPYDCVRFKDLKEDLCTSNSLSDTRVAE
jgi:hypothetical protein